MKQISLLLMFTPMILLAGGNDGVKELPTLKDYTITNPADTLALLCLEFAAHTKNNKEAQETLTALKNVSQGQAIDQAAQEKLVAQKLIVPTTTGAIIIPDHVKADLIANNQQK